MLKRVDSLILVSSINYLLRNKYYFFLEPEKPSIFGSRASIMQTDFRGTGVKGGIIPPKFKFRFEATQPIPTGKRH